MTYMELGVIELDRIVREQEQTEIINRKALEILRKFNQEDKLSGK